MVEQSDSGKTSHPDAPGGAMAGPAPAMASAAKTSVAKASTTVAKGWRRLALLLILMLVAVVAVIVWYGLQFQQHLSGLQQGVAHGVEEDARLGAEISTIELRLTEQRSARVAIGEALSTSVFDIENELKSQARSIAKLTVLDRDQWLFGELEYMARVANERLLTERNPARALLILTAVDKLLLSHDGAGILSVRQVLAGDMAALRAAKVVDRVGLYARLGALLPNIMSLSALPDDGFSALSGADARVADVDQIGDDEEKLSGSESWLLQLWGNTKAAIARFSQDYFHVRYRQVVVTPLLANEQEQWLRHNMVTNIGNAQQALLREEQVIYQACLTTIENHLLKYFIGAHSTAGVLQEIRALQDFSVVQELPDISQSMLALEQLQTTRAINIITGDSQL